MDSRISLDAAVWQEDDYAAQAHATLESWRTERPSVAAFRQFVDSNTCSDYNYESFYYALPYVLDVLESRDVIEQLEMVSILNWKLAYVGEGNLPERCWDQLQGQADRATRILVKLITSGLCSTELLKDSLGAIAALQGEPLLGLSIQRLEA